MTVPDDARLQRLVERLRQGDRLALAQAISAVENEQPAGAAILARVRPRDHLAVTVGVTGPPGAGKSTLINALVAELRRRDRSVAVIAVDPSSPLSGGAILGDRIRMADQAADERVFIRSLAARGHLGGLSRTTGRIVDLMDAAGFDVILIETVGAGQSEVEIADIAATRVVVNAPGQGDDVQAIKAGILEIADILVVNKCDQPLADATLRALRQMLELRRGAAAEVPVLGTVATSGEGLTELVDAIFVRDATLRDAHGRVDPGRRIRGNLAEAVGQLARDRFRALPRDAVDPLVEALRRGELDYGRAAEEILDDAFGRQATKKRAK